MKPIATGAKIPAIFPDVLQMPMIKPEYLKQEEVLLTCKLIIVSNEAVTDNYVDDNIVQ
jgi:hypothetical protein